MPLPQSLVDEVRAAYPDRKLSSEPWLSLWDGNGKLWYITPFDQEDDQVMYSEDGECLTRQQVEDVHGPLHDGNAELVRRRRAERAAAE
jgi:hypothetical protein